MVSLYYNYCIVTIISTTVGNTKNSSLNIGKFIYLHIVIIMTSFIVIIPAVVAVIVMLLVISISVVGLATYIKYKNKTSNID